MEWELSCTWIDCEHEPVVLDIVVEVLPRDARPHADVKVVGMVVLDAAHLGQIDAHAAPDCGDPVLHPGAGAVRYQWDALCAAQFAYF